MKLGNDLLRVVNIDTIICALSKITKEREYNVFFPRAFHYPKLANYIANIRSLVRK